MILVRTSVVHIITFRVLGKIIWQVLKRVYVTFAYINHEQ